MLSLLDLSEDRYRGLGLRCNNMHLAERHSWMGINQMQFYYPISDEKLVSSNEVGCNIFAPWGQLHLPLFFMWLFFQTEYRPLPSHEASYTPLFSFTVNEIEQSRLSWDLGSCFKSSNVDLSESSDIDHLRSISLPRFPFNLFPIASFFQDLHK